MANLKNVKQEALAIVLSDGVERELKFTLNALAEMEERYGSVEKAFEVLETNSIKAVRFVLWCGLMEGEEKLTETQVGSLIDVRNMQEIMGSLGTALSNDMPDEPDKNEKLLEAQDPNVVTPA